MQSYFKEVIDEMTAERGKPPTAKQLASVSGLTVKEAEDVLSTLVVKEPPAKRRRHKQPADPEPSAEEPAPPSVKEPVPATPEVIPSSEDLGTPHYAVLPDNQLGDSQVYPTPPKASGSPKARKTHIAKTQQSAPKGTWQDSTCACFALFVLLLCFTSRTQSDAENGLGLSFNCFVANLFL